jgi:hypothetical protein
LGRCPRNRATGQVRSCAVVRVRDPEESPSPYLLTRLERWFAVGTDAISVAPEHAEGMSGFGTARMPAEGKEEAREIMAACRPVAIA